MKYQVQAGDTLWALAERFYGDGRLNPVIAVVNDLSNPDHIVVGQACGEPTTLVEALIAQADGIGQLSAFAATSFSGVSRFGVSQPAA